MRDKYNYLKSKKTKYNNDKLERDEEIIQKVAIFIYLNKTCYNGLYRVNNKGEFNVPYGQYNNPSIFDPNNLKKVSKLLSNTIIKKRDFEKIVKKAQKNDFIYFDPPYVPISKTSDFTNYAKGNFGLYEQKRLAKIYKELDNKGCYVMESNSNVFLKDDNKIKNELLLKIKHIYENFNIKPVEASRYISCKAEGRKPVKEVVIINYEANPDTQQSKLTIQK